MFGELIQWLREFAAFTEDPSWVPSTQRVVSQVSTIPGALPPSSGLRHWEQVWYTHMHSGPYTYSYSLKEGKSEKGWHEEAFQVIE